MCLLNGVLQYFHKIKFQNFWHIIALRFIKWTVGWCKNEDDVFEITAEPEAFDDIEAALGEKGIETVSAEVTMVPDNTVKVEGDAAVKMQKMLDALDENDDVQEVYGNYEMDEE